ncbi:MAG: uroporphyrinogen decarboxylase family protein [Thermoleophilia bacterium]|nr:uroporphyrinogen decarboxylase family protein [Thermoleophilia bacterium]
MTPKQIILDAYEGKKTERVPVTLFGAGMWSIRNFGTSFEELATDVGKMTDMLVTTSGKLLCDIVYAGSGYNNFHASAFGGGIKYREMGAPDLKEHLVDTAEDIDKLDYSALDRNEVINTVKEALRETKKKIGDEYVVTMTAWGPYTLAARFVGEETMMKATFKRPDFVHKMADFTTGLLIHLFEPLVRDGTLEVISLADPTASGDLISKKQFREFALPYLKKFTDWAKQHDRHTLVHICGNTTDRLDLMVDTGASCISLDHKTDIAKAKETLHGKMCFGGNIDPVAVMDQGSPAQVEEVSRRIIETAGTDGGFVLMPGCDIPPTVPYENIEAFIRTAREWKL